MRFTMKPTVRLLAHAFPVLLVTIPFAINAADNTPGAVLPPPSLMDTPPLPKSGVARPGAPVPSAPAQYTPAQDLPLQGASAQPPQGTSTPPARMPSADVVSSPAQSLQTSNEVQTPRAPWYRRMFGWLPFMSGGEANNEPALRNDEPAPSNNEPAPRVAVTGDPAMGDPQPAGRGSSDLAARGAYAYDSPNRTIRTGMLGQCVRTGRWSTDAATSDCDTNVVAGTPSSTAATVTAAQAPRPYAAGSPAEGPAQPRSEFAEAVPLPPVAALDERLLEPPSDRDVNDQIITALADTRPMSQPALERMTLSAGALFPLSSAAIKPLGREKLDDLVSRLRGSEYETVRVVGHSDPTGSTKNNQRLSKRRAEAVKAYLAAKGIDPKRIKTAGKGGTEPMPKTQDCDALPRTEKIICYAPDRRVEIEVIPGQPRGDPRG